VSFTLTVNLQVAEGLLKFSARAAQRVLSKDIRKCGTGRKSGVWLLFYS
jgi:hypothetical protein